MPAWLFPDDEAEISFETFVARCLFHPEQGYYSHRIPTVGEGGDFSTSATLSSLLARAIAHWVVNRETLLPLIEVGAGDGSLARDIVSHIPLLQRWRIDYHIVETSTPLAQIQQGKAPRRTTWHQDLSSALKACDGKALIFSNELVDAFPPRQFQWNGDQWQELFLSMEQGQIREQWRNVDSLPDSSVFEQEWPSKQRVEVHESFHHYLDDAIQHWSEGEILTIDYGDPVDQIYYRRPGGSMRGFLHHQRLDGEEIYQNPGRQDLTCDVNFTDLIRWGEQAGLRTKQYQTQTDFLEAYSRGTTVDSYLLHPDGPGAAFKVLQQER